MCLFWNSDLTYSNRCLWLAQLLILLQGHVAQPYTRRFMASLQRFVPATCPMKFNKLNSVRHVAGTRYPPNWHCTVIKVSVHTRGHVATTYRWDMYPQHFHVCANVVILSLLHLPAIRPCYMSPQCVLHKFFVPAACRCNMSLQHDPSCLPTFIGICFCIRGNFMPCMFKNCGGTVVYWLAPWTSDLEVGGSSLVSAVMLFP